MASVNKVILLGHIGKHPEIRTTQNGKKIASFSLATGDKWRDKNTGETKQDTQWHNIVIFSEGLVKVVEGFLSKGSQIYLEGSLKTRKWTDKLGNDKYTTEVILQGFDSKIIMLGSKGNYQTDNKSNELEDSIPF